MPCFGGLTPFPKRLGGGKPRAKVILDSLNKGRGTAVDTTQPSPIYCENIVAARAIAAAWGTNQRLAYVWDPKRLTASLITRWEKILALTPNAGDSDVTRRARIAAVFALWGVQPTHQAIVDLLTAAMGSVFVGLEYTSVANAVINVPNGSYPFGVTTNAVPWSSSVAHILIKTQLPSGMTLGQYMQIVALVPPTLDPIVPAWVTFDWYMPGTTSVNVSGGPSAAGFYLDDSQTPGLHNNLDFEVFDV